MSDERQLVYPPGRVPGCLPRKSKPGEWCPMAEERIEIVPQEEWDNWVGRVQVRSKVNHILNQGSVGSCAAEASVQALMIAREIAGLPFVLLNPYFVYHTTSGGHDSGSSIDENLAFLCKHGCASQAVWPRSKGWRKEPSEEAVEDAKLYRVHEFCDIANIPEMVSGELKAHPIVWGANGHAVVKVEHLNDREGKDANSWDYDWGESGFGVWAPYRQVNWGYGAFGVLSVIVPDESPDPPIPRRVG